MSNDYGPGLCISYTRWFSVTLEPPFCLMKNGVAVMQKASRQQPHGSCVYNSFVIACDDEIV